MRLGKIGIGVVVAMAVSACTTLDSVNTVEQRGGVEAPSVTTDQPTYPSGSTVGIHYAGLPGNPTDWLAVSAAGSPETSYLRYQYAEGVVGDWAVGGLAPGDYEARAYENDTFVVLASATFTIDAPTGISITTDKPSYTAGETVQVTFSNLPGNQFDWIAITPHDSAPEVFTDWTYTGGLVNGSFSFSGLDGGQYDARVYVNDSYTIIASATFTMQGTPTVASTAPSYTVGELVTINYSNLPGNPTDWIAIAQAGSPDTSFVAWKYATGASGASSFGNLPAGTYEARAYVNDSFTKIAQSSTFTVGSASPATVTATTPVSAGQPVAVTWSDLPGGQYDWIAVSVAGSDVTSYVDWFYAGAASGSDSFAGLPAGDYEVRAYRNGVFDLITFSTFTVDP